LVSKAGGFTSLAGDEAIIKRQLRGDGKRREVIRIDLKDFMEKGDTSVDVPLQEDDSIFVKQAQMVYVNGEVRSPNGFKYIRNMTVIKAITLANGFTEKAAPDKIKIIRKIDGKERIFKNVKMDMPVLPEDIIVVMESFF
jgi:polysaccharide export outer membrane protein